MSLFKGSLRPPATLSDEAIERYLAAIRAEVEIDPLFRRRLRGQVVNRYVATRDGTGARERQRHMGTLGRAVLYASFSLAVSVTGVLAASQEALPGELLYPFKRQVERLRVQILPDPFHAELAAYALSERIGEMDRLADASDWDRVARLATVVEAGYAELLLTMDSDGADVALHQALRRAQLIARPAARRSPLRHSIRHRSGCRARHRIPAVRHIVHRGDSRRWHRITEADALAQAGGDAEGRLHARPGGQPQGGGSCSASSNAQRRRRPNQTISSGARHHLPLRPTHEPEVEWSLHGRSRTVACVPRTEVRQIGANSSGSCSGRTPVGGARHGTDTVDGIEANLYPVPARGAG